MNAEDYRWLVGTALAVVASVGGIVMTAYKALTNDIAVLHTRINTTRDEYVRRDDLDQHLQRIDGNVNELRREIRAEREDLNRRLDALLERLPPKR